MRTLYARLLPPAAWVLVACLLLVAARIAGPWGLACLALALLLVGLLLQENPRLVDFLDRHVLRTHTGG